MDIVLDFFNQLTNPNWIMDNGGFYFVLLILFIETGIFFGFFLPGDPLLFISGMIIAAAENAAIPFDQELYNLLFWSGLFIISTVLGNMVGYWSGNKFSHFFKQERSRSFLLKPKHIAAAEKFYLKKGGFAILIARFLPVVRTFIPIVGGIVKMNFKRFMIFNILGAILWVCIITSLGFVLGENPWVQKNLEAVIIGLVVLVTAPVIFKMLLGRKQIA